MPHGLPPQGGGFVALCALTAAQGLCDTGQLWPDGGARHIGGGGLRCAVDRAVPVRQGHAGGAPPELPWRWPRTPARRSGNIKRIMCNKPDRRIGTGGPETTGT
jgi:hypothetical protein